jgi:hypothetical protein
MTGRQFSLGISGSPLGQLLAMVVMGVVLIGAVLIGSFVLVALLGLFAVGYSIFWVRSWWRWRMARGRGPAAGGPEHEPARGVRFIEGEYEVIEVDADAEAARRPSGGQ